MEWQLAHKAWLAGNGLSWTDEQLDRWYSDLDRDQLPLPGVIEWQKRIGEQYGRQSGYYNTPLDARAARQIQALQQENQALRQAREGDAARIAWAEDQAARMAGNLADTSTRRDELAARLYRQQQREGEQAAALAELKDEVARLSTANSQLQGQAERARTETGRLKEEITEKSADNGRLRESNGRLEAYNRHLNHTMQYKDSVIEQTKAAASQAQAEGAGTGHALRTLQQLAAWQQEIIAGLEAEKQELAVLVADLQGRVDRLARSITGGSRQLTAGAGARG
jgi:chromosome segregation ATPase